MSGQLASRPESPDPAIQKSLEFFHAIFADTQIKPFAIRLWDGTVWQHTQRAPHFILELKHPVALRRLFWRPNELSLGEAYIYDDFDILGDIETCFEIADFLLERPWRLSEKLRLGRDLFRISTVRNLGAYQGAYLQGRPHTKQRDSQAIEYHYNVSNDFYRLWLDNHMVYSCAFFHSHEEDLDQAQNRKLDYICRKLRLQNGEKLLDIGCGWGGLIIHAAMHYGVDALGITLSKPQADLANERIRQAGLTDRCRVEVSDYRDVSEDLRFDKLVSVGMFEHVGESQLPAYFEKAYRLLKPGGVFLNHGITEAMNDHRNTGPSFIDKYVFPDGELLPISTSLRIAEKAAFELRDVECLREHYAITLRHWVKRLEDHQEKAIALTSPITYRIWRLYMAGSAYGFETGRIGLYQSLLVKSGRQSSGLPLTRCDWYRPCPNEHP